ncbi:alpha-mannosidase [Bacillus litorisediminis]|uniref:alpha-mannosidase n=1 Tax=Bacillus litorisediminis TaxID=2922713 RepID=UPI001FB004C0|nr:alpha-mannosidase [Bacillus litorisediminis]
MEPKITAHIISHSHWDREWYMPFEKHRYYLVKLIDTLIELFEKGEDFQSFHLDGQTIILEDYLQIRPSKKETLKKLIQAKKLHIGPWYVLQDAFLTSSEANVRNMFYGLQDAKEYGAVSKLGYYPDTFGIYGQAPQLLQQAGIDTAAFGRGVKPTGFNNMVSDAKTFESPYSELIWRSPDGSEVLGILFANWYSNGNEVPVDKEQAKKYWDTKLADAKRYSSTPHLLFMNGCDHQPVQTDIGEAIKVAEEQFPNVTFIHSNFDDYIEALRKSLPEKLQTITGELRNQRTDGWSTLVNTASARIYLKQLNQECQTMLEKVAEPLAVFSYLLGHDYPREYLRYAWKTLMKNHPHDSICGCSIDEVHREMVTRFEKVKQVASMIIEEKAKQIVSRMATNQAGADTIPVVVFNTSGNKRSVVVRHEIEFEKIYFSEMPFSKIPDTLRAKEIPDLVVMNQDGTEHECIVDDLGVQFHYDLPEDGFRRPYYARKLRITFVAEELPELGYKTFYLKPQTRQEKHNQLPVSNGFHMENEHVHVEVHENGSFTLTDKETNKVYENLGIYENSGDIGNEYMFRKPDGEVPLTTKHQKADVKVIENNAVRSIIEVIHEWEIPKEANEQFELEKQKLVWHKDRTSGRSAEMVTLRIRTQIELDKKAKGPKVRAVIENNAKDHRLRVLFPTSLATTEHYADSIFEVVKRPNKPEREWENPSFDHHQQAFVSISDGKHGLTIANKGLHEYEILEEKQTIAVTILRATSELGDWGLFPTPEAQCLGTHYAEWMVIPHRGTVISSDAYKEAYDFQVPIVAIQTKVQDGALPAEHTFFSWEGRAVAFSSMKLAEERDDVIVRWFNTSDMEQVLRAALMNGTASYKSTIIETIEEPMNHAQVQTEIKPYEIMSLGWKVEVEGNEQEKYNTSIPNQGN